MVFLAHKLNQTGHNGLEHQAVNPSDRLVPTKPHNTDFFGRNPVRSVPIVGHSAGRVPKMVGHPDDP